jgi:hypothetical protein
MEGCVVFTGKFCPFVAYKIIQNNVQLYNNTVDNCILYMGRKKGTSDDNAKAIAISEVSNCHHLFYLMSKRLHN